MAHGRSRRVRHKKEGKIERNKKITINGDEVLNVATRAVVTAAATAAFTKLVMDGD